MKTTIGIDIPDSLVSNYLSALVNQFFKILPIHESGEPSLKEFMRSLQIELIGAKSIITCLQNDSMYLSLIAILQYLIENDIRVPDDTPMVKREVFKAISICKKLNRKYCDEGV